MIVFFSHAIIYLSHAPAHIFIKGLNKINPLFMLAPSQELVIFRQNFLFYCEKLEICQIPWLQDAEHEYHDR